MIPKILISSSKGRPTYYENAVFSAGGEPVACYCPVPDLSCDGLILAGGGDIDPSYFGEENHGSLEIDLARDKAEFALVDAFLDAGKPVLGICRGHQVLNVALGGSLIQDIGDELRPLHTNPEGDCIHPVHCAGHSLFFPLYGENFVVNSSHHQALGRLGKELTPVLWSESGIVEGLEHDSLPVFSVQFHPERMAYEKRRPDTVDGAPLFRHLIALCQENAHAR